MLISFVIRYDYLYREPLDLYRFCTARKNLTNAAEVRLYAAKKQNTAIESARGTSPETAQQPAGRQGAKA